MINFISFLISEKCVCVCVFIFLFFEFMPTNKVIIFNQTLGGLRVILFFTKYPLIHNMEQYLLFVLFFILSFCACYRLYIYLFFANGIFNVFSTLFCTYRQENGKKRTLHFYKLNIYIYFILNLKFIVSVVLYDI